MVSPALLRVAVFNRPFLKRAQKKVKYTNEIDPASLLDKMMWLDIIHTDWSDFLWCNYGS